MKELAKVILDAAKIREESWTDRGIGPHKNSSWQATGRYSKTIREAILEATPAISQNRHHTNLRQVAWLLLENCPDDALDWAVRVVLDWAVCVVEDK